MLNEITQYVKDRDSHEIRIKRFKEVNLEDTFFDSFKQSYGGYFMEWVEKKRDDTVYIVEESDRVVALVKVKIEDEDEDYSDITPVLPPKRRLKLCSFKCVGSRRLAIRLMDIVISEAMFNRVDEIYGTIPINADYTERLIWFFERFGFRKYGIKVSRGVTEYCLCKKIYEYDNI